MEFFEAFNVYVLKRRNLKKHDLFATRTFRSIDRRSECQRSGMFRHRYRFFDCALAPSIFGSLYFVFYLIIFASLQILLFISFDARAAIFCFPSSLCFSSPSLTSQFSALFSWEQAAHSRLCHINCFAFRFPHFTPPFHLTRPPSLGQAIPLIPLYAFHFHLPALFL